MDDLKPLLEKLISVTQFLANETANLVDDYSSRVDRPYVGGVRQRAVEIREASSQLRTVADTVLRKTDL